MTKTMKLIGKARNARLHGCGLFELYEPEEIERIYNGIGPESWSAWSRRLFTWRYSLFEPAALIHDLRFENSNGLRGAFEAANAEFNGNCRQLIECSCPSRGLRRRFWLWQSKKAALGLKLGSWSAWVEAAEK